MSGGIHPLSQYAFMEWCSVKRSTGTTLTLPLMVMETNFLIAWTAKVKAVSVLNEVPRHEDESID
jgi:hypothetical protein